MIQQIQQEYFDQERFLIARQTVNQDRRDRNHYQGIGTLSEKTVHGVLKNYFEPNRDNQEVALDGYFADIYNEQGVIEIQTRAFDKLREKLAVFLNHYPVTIVYPMPVNKLVCWIDESTGQITESRKSPKHFSKYDAFFELYKIKNFLHNPNIRIKLVLMDVEEYKILNGWSQTKKRGATKYDRIPLGIREIVSIEQPEDYMQFIPYELGGTFTSAEFAKACKITADTARLTLNILYHMETVLRVGKKGNSYLYEVRE